MRGAVRTAGIIACAGLLAGAAAGCSRDKDTPEPGPSRGGTLTVLDAEPDAIDPAQTYGGAYPIVYAVHRPLFRRSDDEDGITPDLAAGEPEISDGGRTLTVRIRRGVRFSPPVGREVVADDVRYGLERGFSSQVASPYAGIYLADLVGAREALAGRARRIRGIETPDDHTLRFRLTAPRARALAGALAMPLSVPVPREYARRFDRGGRSTYGMHQVATGPYMIEHDASGTVTGYDRGRELRLVRNPSWRAETDDRPAHLDRIVLRFGDDPTVAARRVLAGRAMMTGLDFTAPTQLARMARGERGRQIAYEPVPMGQQRFLTMNTTVAPLDDVNVRRAVIAAMDREAVRDAAGGRVFGEVASHMLPPGLPGFGAAGGRKGPGLDYLATPRGDLELAADYLRRAGYPSGRITDSPRLRMWAANVPADRAMGEAVAAQLRGLGFDVQLRILGFEVGYFRYCGRPASRTAFCLGLWTRDFADGVSVLDPLFAGDRIAPESNTNMSVLDEDDVDAAVAAARDEADPERRAAAWARVDRLVMEHAAAVPLVWDRGARLRSPDVRVAGDWTTALAYTSLRR